MNQTWIDRVIDGVFSNTNVGTVDFHYSLTTLQLIRAAVDPAPGGMTGHPDPLGADAALAEDDRPGLLRRGGGRG